MTINAPDPWKHVSGYRLGADGQSIRYRHPNGNEAHIEGMVNEQPDEHPEFEYRPSIISPDGSFVEYPDPFEDKDRAIEKFEKLMHDHA